MARFVIFRIEADGSCIWCDNSSSLHLAQLTVKTLAGSIPGRYLIFDHQRGQGIVMNLSPRAAMRN